MDKNTIILVDALNTIADYDYKSGRVGFCPYGCDTPDIARAALRAYANAIKSEGKEQE